MTPDESRTLGNIEQKLSDLCESFDKFEKQAASNEGFTRCAVHKKQVDNVLSQVKWMRWIITACIAIPILGGAAIKVVEYAERFWR